MQILVSWVGLKVGGHSPKRPERENELGQGKEHNNRKERKQ